MGKNNLQSKSDAALSAQANTFINVVTPLLASYAVTAGDLTTLNDRRELLNSAMDEVATAKAALAAAYDTKAVEKQGLVDQFAYLANKIYANPNVTDAMISAAGLEPRDSSRTKIVPQEPLDLVATPSVNGQVLLKWNRNGNPYGVTFVIEAAEIDGSSWTAISTTTRASVTLSGFTPGAMRWFRVTATKNGQSSAPSLLAAIYAPMPGSSTLQIAA